MPRASALTILIVVLSLTGCDDSNPTLSDIDAVTLIGVRPADFPESAQCGAALGGGKPNGYAYVAELIDVSGRAYDEADPKKAPLDDFVVQSSEAVACDKSVLFGKAFPHREYEVRVRVYADIDGKVDDKKDDDTKKDVGVPYADTDVCTLGNTSVALVKIGEACPGSGTLATPAAELRCYGWQALPDALKNNSTTQNEATQNEATQNEGTEDGVMVGAPARAIDQRLVFAHYCRDVTD